MARIAIVDDSRLARTFTSACMRKAGHETLEIEPTSLFEVLKLLKEYEPQLLITDYLMPECPGNSLVRACAEDVGLSGMKILLVTAHHDEEAQRRLERLGASGFLHKPCEAQVLVEAVDQILGKHA